MLGRCLHLGTIDTSQWWLILRSRGLQCAEQCPWHLSINASITPQL